MSDVLSTTTLVTRPFLGAVLLWAGIAKLRQRDEFARLVVQYRLLPTAMARRVGRWIPSAEVGIGGLLILGFASRWAALCAILMLMGFTTAIGVNLIRGCQLPCLCFGSARSAIGWWTIYRNSGLLLLGLTVLMTPESPATPKDILTRNGQRLPPMEQTTPVVTSAVIFIVVWVLIGEGMRHWRQLADVRSLR